VHCPEQCREKSSGGCEYHFLKKKSKKRSLKSTIQNDPEVERLEKVVDDAFEAFKNCWEYTKKEKDYTQNRIGAGYILKNPTSTLCVPQVTANAVSNRTCQ
jgi:hypothetical protein